MNNFQSSSYNSGYDSYSSKSSSGLGDLIVLVVVGIVIYAFYKTCIDSHSLGDTQYSSTDEDYRGQNPGAGGWADPNRGHGTGGFQQGGYHGSDTCGGARQRGTGAGGGGGGFWTGAATGGLLGYMFGNRNTGYGGYNRGWGGGYNRGWGGWGGGYNRGWGGGGATTGFSGGSTASSGARTASGFGGTRRR